MPPDFPLPPIREFTAALTGWFASAMRPLPWRRDYEPYRVWISEIMLQQTQMERGVNYFNSWMKRFPDILSVANADEQDILRMWEGLGYYSRARNLHAAAKRVRDAFNGVFPRDPADIRALPGVGEYTAGAVASIAFDHPVPSVDANVLRIFSRICDIDRPVSEKAVKTFVTESVAAMMPGNSPRLVNQALMELGALICGKSPKCGECPVKTFCLALSRGTAADRPVKASKPGYTFLEMAAGIVRYENRILIRRRPATGLWAGLWEFPCGTLSPGESAEAGMVRIVREEVGLAITPSKKIAVVKHSYTTNRVTLHGFFCDSSVPDLRPRESGECRWISPEELPEYAFPAGSRKLLERLGWKAGR